MFSNNSLTLSLTLCWVIPASSAHVNFQSQLALLAFLALDHILTTSLLTQDEKFNYNLLAFAIIVLLFFPLIR